MTQGNITHVNMDPKTLFLYHFNKFIFGTKIIPQKLRFELSTSEVIIHPRVDHLLLVNGRENNFLRMAAFLTTGSLVAPIVC